MRKVWLLAAATPLAVLVGILVRARRPTHVASPTPPAIASAAPRPPPDDSHEDERSFVFRVPSGEPTALSCEEARTIVDQVRAGLAYPAAPVSPTAFAASTADWLDPHALFTLAKDSPTGAALTKASAEILGDVEGRRRRDCAGARAPGAALAAWSAELRTAFDRGRTAHDGVTALAATKDPLPPTGLARETAEEIGRRIGAFEARHGAPAHAFAEDARRRFFPSLDEAGWARVVLASAVRAYVPLVDPHGEWAPFDEESRIYEIDLAARPPTRLWGRATPTAVGVRITDDATPPLAVDDVVLSVASVSTAGLPLEQIDQLGYATNEAKSPVKAVVVRGDALLTLELGKDDAPSAPATRDEAKLPIERVPYGDGDVLVVAIKDVKDDLGDELSSLFAEAREADSARKITGVVLDLRGNGGGSTDGALGALSLFLPGAPLFSMKRRDGTVEIDRAPVPRDRDRFPGPVATLIDATTASAAEMIAGALAAYRRGPTIGTTTFGKGCAQEYVDDDAHTGVLRLTTLVYALPDGTPVQRVGLVPQIRFPFTSALAADGPPEREATLPHAAPPWRGPDLREASEDEPSWPSHGGAVGPCKEEETCKAIRLLAKRAPVAKH